MIQVIAYVVSSKDNTKQYVVVQRDGTDDWDCDCKARYFDPEVPCKHINKVRTLSRVQPGEMTLKSVRLTDAGQHILADYRKRHGMPVIAPVKDDPTPTDDAEVSGEYPASIDTPNGPAPTNTPKGPNPRYMAP